MIFGRIIQLDMLYYRREGLFADTGGCHAASGYRSSTAHNSRSCCITKGKMGCGKRLELKRCPTFKTEQWHWLFTLPKPRLLVNNHVCRPHNC